MRYLLATVLLLGPSSNLNCNGEGRKQKFTGVVYFTAEWCTHCNAPMVKEVCRQEKVYYYIMDYDKQTEYCKLWKVKSLPTLILFVDDKPVYRTKGAMSKARFRSLLRKVK